MNTTSQSGGTSQVTATAETREVGPDGVRDPVLHHVNLLTPRLDEMIAWYGRVVGMRPTFTSSGAAFLTNDHANHRLALLCPPGLTEDPGKIGHAGIHHVAFEFAALGDLVRRYAALRAHGILPHACLDHGFGLSYYYGDPDGNSVELQADHFADWSASAAWIGSAEEFAADPIGAYVDPDRILEDVGRGLDVAAIHERASSGKYEPAAPQDLRLPRP